MGAGGERNGHIVVSKPVLRNHCLVCSYPSLQGTSGTPANFARGQSLLEPDYSIKSETDMDAPALTTLEKDEVCVSGGLRGDR